MGKDKITFTIPKTVKHQETKLIMRNIVKILNDDGRMTISDIPQLHRMATSYDLYLTSCEYINLKGAIMVNTKGESVKHPYVNISRESWAQFLLLAREYGLTIKSKAQIDSHSHNDDDDNSPIANMLNSSK